ncbi:hypothetical protein [Gillisia sp. CAL575]|uniref:hypothetical protein n=1 Tax=Gillisia sp. CAL575 TaxID=985255 RepID=UPI00039B01F7|nr:hypothetical protein [Gillisia sp. CAL575]
MKAETAYNVYLALDPVEEKRFKQMIGLNNSPIKKTKKLISDAQAKEYLLKHLNINK